MNIKDTIDVKMKKVLLELKFLQKYYFGVQMPNQNGVESVYEAKQLGEFTPLVLIGQGFSYFYFRVSDRINAVKNVTQIKSCATNFRADVSGRIVVYAYGANVWKLEEVVTNVLLDNSIVINSIETEPVYILKQEYADYTVANLTGVAILAYNVTIPIDKYFDKCLTADTCDIKC